MPKLDSLNDPAFAPIKAQLARCYLRRKADLDVPDVDDANIVARVDDITRTLLAHGARAERTRRGVAAALRVVLRPDQRHDGRPARQAGRIAGQRARHEASVIALSLLGDLHPLAARRCGELEASLPRHEADGDFRHHVHVARYWRTSTSGNNH